MTVGVVKHMKRRLCNIIMKWFEGNRGMLGLVVNVSHERRIMKRRPLWHLPGGALLQEGM